MSAAMAGGAVSGRLLALVWVALFGVYPLADPGHDDLGSPLVWLDLALHFAAGLWLLELEVRRRVRARIAAGVPTLYGSEEP